MINPISLGASISVGSKKPIDMLAVKDRTISKDGNSTFGNVSPISGNCMSKEQSGTVKDGM